MFVNWILPPFYKIIAKSKKKNIINIDLQLFGSLKMQSLNNYLALKRGLNFVKTTYLLCLY